MGETQRMTGLQREMLLSANLCSLPGDGLRIVGPGQHRVAAGLESRGLVRVARPADGRKAHVHVTVEGRLFARTVESSPPSPSGGKRGG